MTSAAIADTSASSMRRGRGTSTANSATTRPGRLDSSRIRSPSRAASRTLWVTNRTVSALLGDDPLELVVEDVAGDRVERPERLVHQQHVGVLGERPGEGDALAHAARQLVRTLVGELAQPHEVEQLERALACARPWPTPRSFSGSSTLAAAVRQGSSAASWNMSAVRPSTSIVPDVGSSSPATSESNVDLPQPEAPTMHTNSPRPTVSEMPSRASTLRRARRRIAW